MGYAKHFDLLRGRGKRSWFAFFFSLYFPPPSFSLFSFFCFAFITLYNGATLWKKIYRRRKKMIITILCSLHFISVYRIFILFPFVLFFFFTCLAVIMFFKYSFFLSSFFLFVVNNRCSLKDWQPSKAIAKRIQKRFSCQLAASR